jgi:hypothetical protein
MTKFPDTPCMQNSEISLDEFNRRGDEIAAHLERAQREGSQERIDALAAELRKHRLKHHPDHWFIDPGSGRDTEDGRLRRRAIQACWADCPMTARLLCLDRGLPEEGGPTLQYGIYGGRTEKQRQAIVAEIQQRKSKRSERPPLRPR